MVNFFAADKNLVKGGLVRDKKVYKFSPCRRNDVKRDYILWIRLCKKFICPY
jgi:hypothetical protein